MRYIKFYRYLLPYWKKEILILLLNGFSFGLALITPYLAKLIIDKAYVNKDPRLFITLAALGGIVFIVISIVNGIINYLNRSIKLSISLSLNRRVFKKLQYFSYGFFQDTATGQHLYGIAYDIERAIQFIADIFPQLIFLIPKSLFIFGMVLYLDRRMALFSLVLLPFLYFTPYFFTIKLKKVMKIWIESSQRIFERAQEILSHMQLVKAFGKERREIKSYIAGLIHNIRLNFTNMRLELTGSFAIGITHRAILGLIIFYGGYQVIRGRMTLGSLSAITLYLSQLSGLQNALANFLQQISLGLVSYQRLQTILDTQPEFQEEERTKEVTFSEGKIEFKNITFGYKQDRMVLESLSLCIEGGSCIGIVGPSGCGKTTTVNLLLRLYKPLKGEILIDGFNINIMKSKTLYRQIGFIPQEPYLWNDTIENNIKYGKEDAVLPEVEEATEIACIDAFINSLPGGYNTIIGENACKISEGQKQRLAIARAVIKKPKILILDEAFSSVDLELETRIIDNIKHRLKDTTIIMISHRLPTINTMDVVCFFSGQGQIDIGRHEELLQRNTLYQSYLASDSR